MLAAAGIPDSPGREEVVQAMSGIRAQHELERKARFDAAREAYLRQLRLLTVDAGSTDSGVRGSWEGGGEVESECNGQTATATLN